MMCDVLIIIVRCLRLILSLSVLHSSYSQLYGIWRNVSIFFSPQGHHVEYFYQGTKQKLILVTNLKYSTEIIL